MTIIDHPFKTQPNRTLIKLSIPVLLSMTAEPITALVDTAFISSLGVEKLAALGVGTTALSSLFWMFYFLGVATQTEVAQLFGRGRKEETVKISSLALLLALGFGLFLIALIYPSSSWLAQLLGASGEVQTYAVSYMRIRLYGAPAVLLMLSVFGTLRGLQDMRTPLWIALGVNVLNVFLDWLLIFGNGPFPAMGVAGSALASTISQWLGALAGVWAIARKLGLSREFTLADTKRLLTLGSDLFVRTAMLNLFLAYTTRVANGFGAEAGAAHQVIRQVYSFTALSLDAFALTVQSLTGFFYGQGAMDWVRKVVKVALRWSLGTGFVLGIAMWLGKDWVISLLVPAASVTVFLPAWAVSAVSQPVNSIAFLTDGTHWGTGDFRFLRNAMIIASIIGVIGVWLIERSAGQSLYWIWIVTGVWVLVRGLFGFLRIWPGIGKSVFKNV